VYGVVPTIVRVHAPWIARVVRRRIAALDGEIDAADERERIVDTDDLLMVRGDERVLSVEAEVDPGMRLPVVERLLQRATRAEHE
jgi:hypothetical protein